MTTPAELLAAPLLDMARIEEDLSSLVGGRRVDLRTPLERWRGA